MFKSLTCKSRSQKQKKHQLSRQDSIHRLCLISSSDFLETLLLTSQTLFPHSSHPPSRRSLSQADVELFVRLPIIYRIIMSLFRKPCCSEPSQLKITEPLLRNIPTSPIPFPTPSMTVRTAEQEGRRSSNSRSISSRLKQLRFNATVTSQNRPKRPSEKNNSRDRRGRRRNG
jgi:hypothetical protein